MDDGSSTNTDSAGGDLSSLLGGVGSSIGADAAQSVVDAANANVPGIAYSAGQSATQGALDTITPYLPYIAIAAVAFVLLSGR